MAAQRDVRKRLMCDSFVYRVSFGRWNLYKNGIIWFKCKLILFMRSQNNTYHWLFSHCGNVMIIYDNTNIHSHLGASWSLLLGDKSFNVKNMKCILFQHPESESVTASFNLKIQVKTCIYVKEQQDSVAGWQFKASSLHQHLSQMCILIGFMDRIWQTPKDIQRPTNDHSNNIKIPGGT